MSNEGFLGIAPAEGESEGLDYEMTAPPEDPMTPPGRWIKQNLFSSVSASIQTVVFALILVGLMRWLLGIIFADESDWTSVATNMRLLMSYNYPSGQYIRIWFTVGTVFGAVGLSFAAWNLNPSITFRRLGVGLIGSGCVGLVFGVVTPSTTPDRYRFGMFVVGAVLLITGLVLTQAISDPHKRRIPFGAMLLVLSGLVVAFLWLYPLGRYESSGGEITATAGTVNETTKTPWTVAILILLVCYFGGRALGRALGTTSWLRTAMIVFWVVGPAFLVFLVLRDPSFEWAYILKVDMPIAIAFSVGGGVLLYAISKPGRVEQARLVAVLLLVFALFNWVAAFFGWYEMLQKVRISFLLLALFALMAPTFAGDKAARLRFAGIWFSMMVLMHWLITGMNTPSTLDIQAPPFLGGLVLTITIAYYVMLASFPLGVILALARTSRLPIFRVLSTTYIEVIRGIPLITVLFFFSILLPLFLPPGMGISELAAIFAGYSVFSAAYMAENIRGGLQSIRKGQYEASDALGLTTVQRTAFIVLPQALRVSIPNIVGQAIAIFKETSLIAIVGGFDLLRVADKSIAAQPEFLGQKRPALLFVCVVYWIFAYSMSRASRNLEVRLGVGEGR